MQGSDVASVSVQTLGHSVALRLCIRMGFETKGSKPS